MSWVVDTCLVIDVLEDDPLHGASSAALLDKFFPQGLALCPVSFAELAPAFGGDIRRQCYFLDAVGIEYAHADWSWEDTKSAHAAWHRHIGVRRTGKVPKRPIADILIGSFALRYSGILTRNASDFKNTFPSLMVKSP